MFPSAQLRRADRNPEKSRLLPSNYLATDTTTSPYMLMRLFLPPKSKRYSEDFVVMQVHFRAPGYIGVGGTALLSGS